VTLRERLGRAVELGVTVALSPEELRELLGDGAPLVAEAIPTHDLTVREVAARLGRPVSTIRAWIAAGRFESAYKLSERDWRVPVAAVTAFVEARKPLVVEGLEPAPVKRRPSRRAADGEAVDLGAWRKPG